MRCLPTSYLETVARQKSMQPGSKSFEEWMAQLSATYGMDKDIISGFVAWCGKAITGDFGDSWYWTVPVINGKTYSSNNGEKKIGFWAFTREDFSGLSSEEKRNGPRPTFKESTYSFGKVRKGEKVTASYTFKNDGKSVFKVYKVDADAKIASVRIPDTAPGGSMSFKVELDTADMPKGESLTIVTLTTNSPLRPIVNLFIAGFIE
jgi:hypothetical protein